MTSVILFIMSLCACVYVRARMCMRALVCMCVRARACVCVLLGVKACTMIALVSVIASHGAMVYCWEEFHNNYRLWSIDTPADNQPDTNQIQIVVY